VLAVVVGLALIVALVWIGRRIGMPAARDGDVDSVVTPAADSVAPDIAPDTMPPEELNPGDTARAAAFAVELALVDEPAARRLYRNRPPNLLSATIAPVAGDSVLSYRVASGAFTRRSTAANMLTELRTGGTLAATGGVVMRLPYAVQLESGVPRDSLRAVLNRFRARDISAYALAQPNGSSHIYVGAFATPNEARALLADLQAAGVPAALAVRIGRPL
jgi:hypothetical protein